MYKLLQTLILCGISISTFAASIRSQEAILYVGTVQTVCGDVAEVALHRNDTFINLDRSYPNQSFYIYLPNYKWEVKSIFKKKVCVTGQVRNHNGKAQIIISNPKQIKIY